MAPSDLNAAQLTAVAIFGLVFLAFGLAIYARLVVKVHREGGAVRASCFDLPDLMVAIVLATFFGGLVVKAALRHGAGDPDMTADQVLQSSLLFLVFAVGLGAFLRLRGLRFGETFGFTRVSAPRVAGWAALLVLAAFPFVSLANGLAVLLLRNQVIEQSLVRLFRAAAQRGDLHTVGAVALAAVAVAPVCEEFLFRGFFYGVGKRYAGAWISGLVTALLFAAFHASLVSLPGLFVLALALTLAYERTGSLAVSITMHALFNATNLGILYLQATNRLVVK